MQRKTDAELLREYATAGSDAAFAEIVRRYADMVYSAALRQLGNDAQARDVAQTVFVDLARKGASLRRDTVLIGWLHRGVRLAALEQRRTDHRRWHRERQAMQLLDPAGESSHEWKAIRPKLDEAIASLGSEDRDALLLRFFRDESLAKVGTVLGISEDAAQKRISRALVRLREWLAERGIHTTAGALSAALAANAVQAAPPNWAASLATGALAGSAAPGSGPLSSLFTFTPVKAAIVVIAVTTGLVLVTLSRSQSQDRLRATQTLVQEQASTIERLHLENERLQLIASGLERARADAREVLPLRAEVARLRRLDALRKATVLEPEAIEPVDMPSAPHINMKVRVIRVPNGSTGFSYDRTLPSAQATGVLARPEVEFLLRQLGLAEGEQAGKTNSATTAQAQVTTLTGRQAQIQVELPGGDGGPPTTLVVDLRATCQTNSPEVTFDLVRGSLVEAGATGHSAGVSGTEPLPVVRNGGFTSGGKDHLALFSADSALTLWDGQTLVMSHRLPVTVNQAATTSGVQRDPEDLLALLVTPTLIDPAGNELYPKFLATEVATEETGTAVPVFPGTVPE